MNVKEEIVYNLELFIYCLRKLQLITFFLRSKVSVSKMPNLKNCMITLQVWTGTDSKNCYWQVE